MATKGVTSSKVDLVLKCLILVARGFLFFTEKPFYQEMIMERGWDAVDRYRHRGYEREIRKKIKYLKHRDFIKEKKIGENILYVLTEKGQMRLLQEQIKSAGDLRKCYQVRVEYDFPEEQSEARDAFRYFLKKSGFSMFQKSIWVSRKNVTKLIRVFINQNNLNKWVDVIECKSK